MIKPVNNVSFTARVKVDITDEYLDELKDNYNAEESSAQLLQGLNTLSNIAPMIGTDKDVLKLSNIPPKDRPFFSGNKSLLLSLNNDLVKVINPRDYAVSIKSRLAEFFFELMDKQENYKAPKDIDDTFRQIREFNTEV